MKSEDQRDGRSGRKETKFEMCFRVWSNAAIGPYPRFCHLIYDDIVQLTEPQSRHSQRDLYVSSRIPHDTFELKIFEVNDPVTPCLYLSAFFMATSATPISSYTAFSLLDLATTQPLAGN